MIFWFFQSFPLPFPLLKFFSFNYLITFLVSFIWNSQKCPVSQNIWCLFKTQLKDITQTIFFGGSPWATLIHNSVVCLRVHYCVLLLPEVMIFWFFQSFPLPFPLLKFFSFNYLITFLVSFIWNSLKCPISQNIWHLIKTQLKNITQTIFQGGSPWATLIHNSVVCLRVHYCVLLLPEVMIFWFFQSFPLPFPLLKFFSFNYLITFLVSFIWNSQKCPISQNIWHLIKTQLKNITQTIFQGGSPWATLIHNSVVCLGVHYCVLLLPVVIFFAIISFTFSFAKTFFFYGIFMVLLLDFYGIPMGFPWCFYDISGGFLWDFWRDAMGVLWYSYGISIGFLWDFYGISIGFLWNFYWIPVGFPRYFHDVSMIFLWDYYWNSHGISLWFLCYSMLFLWSFYGISVGFLWDLHGISMIFLWDYYWISMGCRLKVNWQ